jgi:hypothetical protein
MVRTIPGPYSSADKDRNPCCGDATMAASRNTAGQWVLVCRDCKREYGIFGQLPESLAGTQYPVVQ